ncbi:MAG: hypothetical protein R3E76_07880 [Planctomycetota bacterium]
MAASDDLFEQLRARSARGQQDLANQADSRIVDAALVRRGYNERGHESVDYADDHLSGTMLPDDHEQPHNLVEGTPFSEIAGAGLEEITGLKSGSRLDSIDRSGDSFSRYARGYDTEPTPEPPLPTSLPVSLRNPLPRPQLGKPRSTEPPKHRINTSNIIEVVDRFLAGLTNAEKDRTGIIGSQLKPRGNLLLFSTPIIPGGGPGIDEYPHRWPFYPWGLPDPYDQRIPMPSRPDVPPNEDAPHYDPVNGWGLPFRKGRSPWDDDTLTEDWRHPNGNVYRRFGPFLKYFFDKHKERIDKTTESGKSRRDVRLGSETDCSDNEPFYLENSFPIEMLWFDRRIPYVDDRLPNVSGKSFGSEKEHRAWLEEAELAHLLELDWGKEDGDSVDTQLRRVARLLKGTFEHLGYLPPAVNQLWQKELAYLLDEEGYACNSPCKRCVRIQWIDVSISIPRIYTRSFRSLTPTPPYYAVGEGATEDAFATALEDMNAWVEAAKVAEDEGDYSRADDLWDEIDRVTTHLAQAAISGGWLIVELWYSLWVDWRVLGWLECTEKEC